MWFYVTHATGPYTATICRGTVLTLDHIGLLYILFWPHKNMEGLLGWGLSSLPEPPPRQYEHESRDTPVTYSFFVTRQMWKDDYDGQTVPIGRPCGPKASWHLSYRRGKTQEKSSPRKLVPSGDLTRACCVTGGHATACSTAVDKLIYMKLLCCHSYCMVVKLGLSTSERSRG